LCGKICREKASKSRDLQGKSREMKKKPHKMGILEVGRSREM